MPRIDVFHYKAGQTTAAFSSPSTPWDTVLAGTSTPPEYLAFLRITSA